MKKVVIHMLSTLILICFTVILALITYSYLSVLAAETMPFNHHNPENIWPFNSQSLSRHVSPAPPSHL